MLEATDAGPLSFVWGADHLGTDIKCLWIATIIWAISHDSEGRMQLELCEWSWSFVNDDLHSLRN